MLKADSEEPTRPICRPERQNAVNGFKHDRELMHSRLLPPFVVDKVMRAKKSSGCSSFRKVLSLENLGLID